jgi:alpha-L-fucosidase
MSRPYDLSRRSFVSLSAAALAGCVVRHPPLSSLTVSLPRPSPSQLQWQRDELAMFLHFGVNTFTDREWGDGQESPSIFNPGALDARQWAQVAKAADFRTLILTAKHHDGFCLWPTKTTKHSVASSPWRSGNGDVVRELVDACRAESLNVGLYLSPWDRNNPTYGDSDRYNDLYCDQLTELLTRYGKISEVWFDGANGEGPNGKRQRYDWPRVWSLVRRLQPDAVMFSDAGPDVRWCGNERGSAGDPNWSTVDPSIVTYPGADGPKIIDSLQHGDPHGTVWRPAEVDVSIRPGWFYHPAEDSRVRSVDDLVGLYFSSVGRNSKLLLNVPPTRDGLLHQADVARLQGMSRALDATFNAELAAVRSVEWRVHGTSSAYLDMDIGASTVVSVIRLEENIPRGQRVARYTITGSFGPGELTPIASGTTIGYTKLERLSTPRRLSRIRLTIDEAVAEPEQVRVRIFST